MCSRMVERGEEMKNTNWTPRVMIHISQSDTA